MSEFQYDFTVTSPRKDRSFNGVSHLKIVVHLRVAKQQTVSTPLVAPKLCKNIPQNVTKTPLWTYLKKTYLTKCSVFVDSAAKTVVNTFDI